MPPPPASGDVPSEGSVFTPDRIAPTREQRDRHRNRGAILVSADIQPAWYLSVIDLQTFGNTMGNVGRGIRLQSTVEPLY